MTFLMIELDIPDSGIPQFEGRKIWGDEEEFLEFLSNHIFHLLYWEGYSHTEYRIVISNVKIRAIDKFGKLDFRPYSLQWDWEIDLGVSDLRYRMGIDSQPLW